MELIKIGQASIVSNADFNGNWIKENLSKILLSNPAFRGGVTRRAAEKIGEVALELIEASPK